MSYVNDFFKLDFPTKATVIGICLLMPFWYIDIYLFHRQFFSKAPIYLPIVFSFCLTVCWLIPCYCIATIMIVQEVIKEAFKGTFKGSSQNTVINKSFINKIEKSLYNNCISISIILIAILTYFGYIFSIKFNTFLIIAFIVCVIVFILSLVWIIFSFISRLKKINLARKIKANTNNDEINFNVENAQ
jgi:hypothetical protein